MPALSLYLSLFVGNVLMSHGSSILLCESCFSVEEALETNNHMHGSLQCLQKSADSCVFLSIRTPHELCFLVKVTISKNP